MRRRNFEHKIIKERDVPNFKNLEHLICFLLWGMTVSFFAFSCQPAPKGKTKSEVIQERIQKKVDAWVKSVEDKCERDVMSLATRLVDSTLIANARARKERESRPKKPRKPGQPHYEIPEDTTPIAPLILYELLLRDSTFLDSLLSADSLILSDTLELELLKLLEADSLWQE